MASRSAHERGLNAQGERLIWLEAGRAGSGIQALGANVRSEESGLKPGESWDRAGRLLALIEMNALLSMLYKSFDVERRSASRQRAAISLSSTARR